jgi:ABC-type Fe3+ transport system substrate-binding protein
MRTAMRILVTIACAALALAGCRRPGAEVTASGERRASPAGEELVIVSPHDEYIRYEFGHGFERWYLAETGKAITVDWRDMGGTSEDVRFIRGAYGKVHEGEGIMVDIFFGGGIPPYDKLAGEGLFEPYRLPDDLLQRIPAAFPGGKVYDPEYRFYGTVFSGFGIMYNKEVLRRLGLPEPQSWEDLARPDFVSWVGMGDPRSSGSALMVFQIILQAYGWEKGWDIITRMSGNIRYFTASASAIPKDVALGEIAVGGAIDFYAATAIERVGGDRLGFVLPEGKTVMNPDPIAILKNPPHRELAQAFVRFVMSEEGQRLWFLPPGSPGGPEKYNLRRLPVMPEVYKRYADLVGNIRSPYDWRTDFVYDEAKASGVSGVLQDLLGTFVIEAQYELVPAWKACIAAGLPPQALAELTRMPISEEEALALGEKWGQPAQVESRVMTLTEWSKTAAAKYRQARLSCSTSRPRRPSPFPSPAGGGLR